ncbi:MAG: SDR family oxidoreductase [Paludibacteraceae bacterium]|nr:SDR family oxidoreductase [Paludibacteraceae bacterium]
MSQLLAGKKGVIFGALDERSLAWHVALRCMEEGAQIVLTNTEVAIQLGTVRDLASAHGLPLIVCDATNLEDIRDLFARAQELLGGQVDFVLHAVAQSTNLRRHKSYEEANYTYFQQTIDISALSLHKILHTAMEMDAIAEGGSVVALSYIASERYFYGYNDMGDAKAMLESIARQMGALYGRKKRVRVNIVSPSPITTKAGGGWKEIDFFYRYSNHLSPLGNADADDCAGVCVVLFSDLMKRVTMQTIYCDGGFGRTILTPELVDDYRRIEEVKDKNED